MANGDDDAEHEILMGWFNEVIRPANRDTTGRYNCIETN